jgi:hypothetical protein
MIDDSPPLPRKGPTMEKQFREIILHTVVTALCCILLGLIVYQGSVFNRTHYAFQFVTFGIAGSLFFHTLRLANVKVALFVMAGLILIQIFINRSADFWLVVRDLLAGISLGSAIYLFFANYYTHKKVQGVMTPITLGALLAATNLAVTIVLVLINGVPILQSYPSILVNVMLGFLVGCGIGAGILVSARVVAH